jgi:hypothetical protein
MGFVVDAIFGGLGAHEQAKAADRSAQASTQATQQTIDYLRQSRDLARSDQEPWRQMGQQALGRLGQLYGFGSPAGATPVSAPANSNASGSGGGLFGNLISQLGSTLSPQQLQQLHQQYPNLQLPSTPNTPQTVPAQPPLSQSQQTMNWLAMDPGYQFRLNEGMNALNTGFASRGMLHSGAAAKSALQYGQNYASNEFGNAYNRLSALAGVGQTANAQNQLAGQNFANGAGNALMQNAQNLGSSYTQKGNAWSGFYGGLSGSLNSYGNMAMNLMGGF